MTIPGIINVFNITFLLGKKKYNIPFIQFNSNLTKVAVSFLNLTSQNSYANAKNSAI